MIHSKQRIMVYEYIQMRHNDSVIETADAPVIISERERVAKLSLDRLLPNSARFTCTAH